MHVVFAWELGAGLGHLVRYQTLTSRLLATGHKVSFIAREPAQVPVVFPDADVGVYRAPYARAPQERQIRSPNSLAEIIWNCGFHDREILRERAAWWRNTFRELAADVVVADHSPTALLGARLDGTPAIPSGSGFLVPPMTSPLPLFRVRPETHARPATTEQGVLACVNHCLTAAGRPPLTALAEMLSAEPQFLMTFKELDHYPQRGAADYLGSLPNPTLGLPVTWPGHGGPRVFAYLNPRIALPEILNALIIEGVRVCLYAPGADLTAMRTAGIVGHPQISVMEGPVDMRGVAAAAEFAVTNGNFNTISGLLLDGIPQLMITYDIEKYLAGRRVQALGAGVLVPRARLSTLRSGVAAMLGQSKFRRVAQEFARRHDPAARSDQLDYMLARVLSRKPAN